MIKPEETTGTNIVPAMSTVCGEPKGHVERGVHEPAGPLLRTGARLQPRVAGHDDRDGELGPGKQQRHPADLERSAAEHVSTTPPNGTNTIGQPPCGTWYDNDTLNNGNFGFLTLNPEGWDVPIDDNCSGAQSGGSNQLADWISGHHPDQHPVELDGPDVRLRRERPQGELQPLGRTAEACRPAGRAGLPHHVGGCGVPAVPCPPAGSAVSQGAVYQSGNIDKYDVIGFAALMILDVVTPQEAGNGTTTQQPFTNFTYTNTGITFPAGLPSGAMVSYTWTGSQDDGTATTLERHLHVDHEPGARRRNPAMERLRERERLSRQHQRPRSRATESRHDHRAGDDLWAVRTAAARQQQRPVRRHAVGWLHADG